MEAYWIWWLVALVLVIAEMSSGTFYLIAVAFGLAVAASLRMGVSWSGQAAVAAALCSASVAGIYRWNNNVRAHET
jgi:membrane protein implicated in regulation of membrane protease activity